MKVLIIGAGNTGRNLAIRFCEERHDVVVMDLVESALKELQDQHDVMVITGSGSNPKSLEQAGIDNCDMVVAVTDVDEINLLACMQAKAHGVSHTIARVAEPDFLAPSKLDFKRMGIDLLINQKLECAIDLFNVLRMPGADETADLLDGQAMAVGLKVHMDSPLLAGSLKSFPEPKWLESIRFIAIRRGQQLLVPRGDTTFLVGDVIYFVGRSKDILAFVGWAWPENPAFSKIVIAGGGQLGLSLAQMLENAGINTVVVEENKAIAQRDAHLVRGLVLYGNPLEADLLEQAGFGDNTAFVAVTGDDEDNIISCMVAAKLGARFTAAEIDKLSYVPIINNLSLLDRAVNPHLSMVSSILHFVRGKNVRAAAVLRELPGELLEILLPDKSPWINKPIKRLKLPEGVTMAVVQRDTEIFTATGDLTLYPQDRLVLYCTPEARVKLNALFKK